MGGIILSIVLVIVAMGIIFWIRQKSKVSDTQSLEEEISSDFIDEFGVDERVGESLVEWLEEDQAVNRSR